MKPEPIVVINRDDVFPFTTKDGSTIREIIAPNNAPGAIVRQSLAEATIPPNGATMPHFHPVTEEIYYILQGEGHIQIGSDVQTVSRGDGIAIPPGAPHTIKNTGSVDLVFLCCCSPAYSHADTIMTEMPAPLAADERSDNV